MADIFGVSDLWRDLCFISALARNMAEICLNACLDSDHRYRNMDRTPPPLEMNAAHTCGVNTALPGRSCPVMPMGGSLLYTETARAQSPVCVAKAGNISAPAHACHRPRATPWSFVVLTEMIAPAC